MIVSFLFQGKGLSFQDFFTGCVCFVEFVCFLLGLFVWVSCVCVLLGVLGLWVVCVGLVLCCVVCVGFGLLVAFGVLKVSFLP